MSPSFDQVWLFSTHVCLDHTDDAPMGFQVSLMTTKRKGILSRSLLSVFTTTYLMLKGLMARP